MVNLMNVLAAAPNGLWEKIIFKANSIIGNYAVAIILITIAIKLLLLPIDYINKKSSAKMSEMQTKLAPKIKSIKEKYKDQTTQNQKMQELYKNAGFNPMGSCLTMFLVMVASIGVFITLFASLNNVAQYKIVTQYEQLQVAYVQEYVEDKGINVNTLNKEQIGEYIIEISTSGDENIISAANTAVKEKYNNVKDSFLWIKNVWVADSPANSAIPGFKSYSTLAKLNLEGEALLLAETQYNAVMSNLKTSEGVNGYYILAILTGITAFLSQYLAIQKKKKKENFYTKDQNDPQASSGKVMLIVLPIIMVVFTLSYNSIFSMYIIASQLVSIAAAPIINHLMNKSEKTKKLQKK